MIENWSNLSPEQRMQSIIREMANNYYNIRQIDKIPEAINIIELSSSNSSTKEFFRIALHSNIPYHYLEEDIPIIGMEMMGKSIVFGENKALLDCVSNNTSVIMLDKLNFNDLIQDAIERIGSIGAIFYPIKFFTQLHNELDIQYTDDFTTIKIDTNEIKMIETNFSGWDHVVILGRNSIEWTRKISFNLPPNLSNYHKFSSENEHFQSAYLMSTNESKYMINTISYYHVIDSSNIIVYSPTE